MTLIKTGLETFAEYGKISEEDIPSILSRITTTSDMESAASKADYVIEAIPELPDAKKALFATLDEFCPPDTVIASNTSGLDLFSLAETKRPDKLIIAHFFSPAHIIPLVEVVPGAETSEETVTLTSDLMKKVGHSPVVLKQFIQSFIVNRIQNAIGPVVIEMLENGWAEPEDIDLAAKLVLGVRLPIVGVAQTADFNGLDTILDIFKRIGKPSAFFEKKVEQGHLGVKTSKGIFDYGGRSEAEVLKKRDILFLKMLDHLKEIKAFEPV
jgi:3-hydroxybutyryl-CoA dehydrogenase